MLSSSKRDFPFGYISSGDHSHSSGGEDKYYIIVMNVVSLNTIVVVGLNLLIGLLDKFLWVMLPFMEWAYLSAILTTTYGFPLATIVWR
jgi:hypothetical protein